MRNLGFEFWVHRVGPTVCFSRLTTWTLRVGLLRMLTVGFTRPDDSCLSTCQARDSLLLLQPASLGVPKPFKHLLWRSAGGNAATSTPAPTLKAVNTEGLLARGFHPKSEISGSTDHKISRQTTGSSAGDVAQSGCSYYWGLKTKSRVSRLAHRGLNDLNRVLRYII